LSPDEARLARRAITERESSCFDRRVIDRRARRRGFVLVGHSWYATHDAFSESAANELDVSRARSKDQHDVRFKVAIREVLTIAQHFPAGENLVRNIFQFSVPSESVVFKKAAACMTTTRRGDRSN
jgi:hypothetical protein